MSALGDVDGDGKADWLTPVLEGWATPNGIAWHNGSLFVATISSIYRLDDIDSYALANKVRLPPCTLLHGPGAAG